LQIAKKNKEKYTQEMEAYKQNKDEEAMNLKKEEEELMEFQREKDPRGWKDWIF
jgi:upstream-binding transcription factor